jgi:hypothetical protein
MGILLRSRLASEEPDPAASRGKVARLTSAGLREQRLYTEFLGIVEDRWVQRYGRDTMTALRQATEVLAASDDLQPPLLVRPPGTLPYYPMVLHRGGYPDGS